MNKNTLLELLEIMYKDLRKEDSWVIENAIEEYNNADDYDFAYYHGTSLEEHVVDTLFNRFINEYIDNYEEEHKKYASKNSHLLKEDIMYEVKHWRIG